MLPQIKTYIYGPTTPAGADWTVFNQADAYSRRIRAFSLVYNAADNSVGIGLSSDGGLTVIPLKNWSAVTARYDSQYLDTPYDIPAGYQLVAKVYGANAGYQVQMIEEIIGRQ